MSEVTFPPRKHIAQMNNKTAAVLCLHLKTDDAYHQNIMRGAQAMVHSGRQNAEYVTQYASGVTVWQVGEATESVS